MLHRLHQVRVEAGLARLALVLFLPQAGNQHILIAAVTGLGQEEDERKSREAGFDAHLVKPVEHAALLALLAGQK